MKDISKRGENVNVGINKRGRRSGRSKEWDERIGYRRREIGKDGRK